MTTTTITHLDEALEVALKLSPKDRLRLTERILASLEGEVGGSEPSEAQPPEEHWGNALNRLLDELGPIEFVHPEIDDPVEWVKVMREEAQKQRLGDWGETE